jgi:hypothetical protein
MKRKFLFILSVISCFIFNPAASQIKDPVHWSFHATKIDDCEFELVIQAKLDEGWHLYGQKSYGDDGPVPTSFHYTLDSNYELIGKTSEETLIKKFEPVFKLELNYFEHEAFFKQKVKIKSDQAIEIKGDFEFMVCNDVTCIPPSTIPFSFKIEGSPDCLNQGSVFVGTSWRIWSNLVFFVVFIFFSVSFLGGIKIANLSRFKNKFRAVNVAAGFLSLALVLKFASNADLSLQTGIITREIFISFLIVITGLWSIYLLGRIKFSQDDELEYVSVSRLFSAILVLSFTIYILPGLWGAPLKLIHGFLPPGVIQQVRQPVSP